MMEISAAAGHRDDAGVHPTSVGWSYAIADGNNLIHHCHFIDHDVPW
jgi:hypothetical protein